MVITVPTQLRKKLVKLIYQWLNLKNSRHFGSICMYLDKI